MSEMNWEDVDDAASLEYPFQCSAEVPTLQQMASYRVSQAIWHAYLSSIEESRWMIYPHDVINMKNNIEKLVEGLKLARPIEEILKQYANKTRLELFDWVRSLGAWKVTYLYTQELKIDMNWCIWLPNGEIDYRRSAMQILNNGRLNEKQKFVIISAYCMEDLMKTISLETIQYFEEAYTFDEEPLLFYWVCYWKKNLERVPLNEDRTLEETMVFECFNQGQMIGVEYFWSFLTNDQRIDYARSLISQADNCKLTTLQRLVSSIYSSSIKPLVCISTIFLGRCFREFPPFSRYPLVIWHRFKNHITGNDFASMFKKVLRHAVRFEDMQMSVHMWDTAYDHQKEYSVQHEGKQMISTLVYLRSHSIYPLIRRILSQKPELQRSELLERGIDYFVDRFEQIEQYEEMLDSCLPNAQEQSQFKHSLSRSAKLQQKFVSLLIQDKYTEFDRILEWVLSDQGPNAIIEYKKRILRLMTWKHERVSSIDSWKKLNQFIDLTYLEDKQSAFYIKERLIERETPVTGFGQLFWQSFDITRQIAEMVLPFENLARFKCILRHNFRKQLQWNVFWNDDRDDDKQDDDYDYRMLMEYRDRRKKNEFWEQEHNIDQILVKNFVEWCCDCDAESLSKFQKEFPRDCLLDSIVTRVMNRCPSTRPELEILLRRMDWYLKLFIGSEEDVTECKLQAIEFSTIDVREFKGWTLYRSDQQCQEILFRWFCGGDEATIRKLWEEEE